MASKKKTGWYEPGQKPARKGVYETRVPAVHGSVYQRWNGRYWNSYSSTPSSAARATLPSRLSKQPRWRGFAEEQRC